MTPTSDPHTQPVEVQARLNEVVAGFLTDFATLLHDPAAVHDRCMDFADRFTRRCVTAGIPARTISGAKTGELPQFPGQRLILQGHFATVVTLPDGPVVYDFTARQFDPDAPVPVCVAEPVWRTQWPRIG